MIRQVTVGSTVVLALGCGGTSSTPVAVPTAGSADPRAAGTGPIFEQHVARNGGTYPVPDLPGDVTCYGGDLIGAGGAGQIETYLRRGIDATTGVIVEDLVTLFRDNPKVHRYTFTIAAGGELREVSEVNHHFTGRATVVLPVVRYYLDLKESGLFLYQYDRNIDGGLEQVSLLYMAPYAADLAKQSRSISTPEEIVAFEGFLDAALSMTAGDKTKFQHSRATLTTLPADHCAQIFATFPPPT